MKVDSDQFWSNLEKSKQNFIRIYVILNNCLYKLSLNNFTV